MKLRAILIIGLIALLFIAPALADKVFIMDTTYSQDKYGNPRAVNVHFEKVVETDTSDIFSPYNYPPDKYQYITLYYTLYNPSGSDVDYEFNISIKDRANHVFTTDDFILAEKVPAKGNLPTRVKYYAVYRNSTGLQFIWTDKVVNPPWDHYDTPIDINLVDITPTPAAAPVTTPTPTPTATPVPANPIGQCLPFLPLGLIIGGIGCVGWISKKHKSGR